MHTLQYLVCICTIYLHPPSSFVIVMTAVSPPTWNCPRGFSEVPLMRMVSSDSTSLSSTIVNTVFLNVPGPSPARNVTTLGTGPLKSTEAKKGAKAICLGFHLKILNLKGYAWQPLVA